MNKRNLKKETKRNKKRNTKRRNKRKNRKKIKRKLKRKLTMTFLEMMINKNPKSKLLQLLSHKSRRKKTNQLQNQSLYSKLKSMSNKLT